MKLTCIYKYRPKRATCNTAFVQTAFGIDPDIGDNVIARGVEIEYAPGKIVLFTGPSGSGKSSLLRQASRRIRNAVRLDDFCQVQGGFGKKAIIDCLCDSAEESAHLLSLCGLGEAYLMLRSPGELSDGQRYRFALAKCLAEGKKTVIADEWCAKLDRLTAKVLSRNARKVADKRRIGMLLATTHEDIIDDLQPDIIVTPKGGGVVEVKKKDHPAGPSVFTAGSKSPKVPRRTGLTSLGGIIAVKGWGRSAEFSCSGTGLNRSVSALSDTGLCRAAPATGTSP